MKSNCEIRSEAWNLLMRRGWIWKLLGASILLTAFYIGVGQTVLYRELRSSAAKGE